MMTALWRNEWQFYLRQPLCWLALLLAIAFTALLALAEPVLSAQPQKELLFNHSKLLMLVHPLLLGVLAPLAFYRDSQHNMQALIAATPLTRWQWGLSRAGALFLLVFALQIGLTLFVTTVAESAATAVTTSSLWPLACQLLLVQQLPALLLLITLHLWCSQQSQQLGWSWLLTLCCWLGYMLLAAGTGSPLMAQGQQWSPWLSQAMYWLDPYALTPWLAQLQQGDTGLSADVWLNRLLILLLTALLGWRALAAAPAKVPHRQPANESSLPTSTPSSAGYTAEANSVAVIPVIAIRGWPAFVSLLRLQYQQLLLQRSSLLALLLLLGLIFSEVLTSTGFAEPMSRLTPTSRDALNQINWDILPRFGLLLICFWASQLSWLNRQQRCDTLIAASPQPGWLLLSSQLATLWLLSL